MRTILLASLLTLIACGDKDTDDIVDTGDTDAGCVDEDNDLSCVEEDCNDGDPLVRPGAWEVWYDGVDQNCDGANDYDQDADGYDHDLYGGDDCDDTRASVNPDAEEVNGDTSDNDCNGTINKRSYVVDYDMTTGAFEVEVCGDDKIETITAVYYEGDPSEWVKGSTEWVGVSLHPSGWGNCKKDDGELIINPPVPYAPTYVMYGDGAFTALGLPDNVNCLIWGEHADVTMDFFKEIAAGAGYTCAIHDPTTY